jgi:hypothetical protein
MSNKKTAGQDLNPQSIKIGKWEFPPLTINTAILLERIDSPFMRVDIDPETGKQKQVIPTIEEFARTLYVLVSANDPRLHGIIADENKFRVCVSELAKQISFKELAGISKALNQLMSSTDDAIKDSGMEGDGEKKETGASS